VKDLGEFIYIGLHPKVTQDGWPLPEQVSPTPLNMCIYVSVIQFYNVIIYLWNILFTTQFMFYCIMRLFYIHLCILYRIKQSH
jgi:hypothetical protein